MTEKVLATAWMRIALALSTTALLGGCALQVASSNPRQVIINHPGGPPNTQEAQRLADAECAKHRRFAKMSVWPIASVSRHWVFECVD